MSALRLAALCAVLLLGAAERALAVPPDFEEVTLAAGLSLPTAVAWTPDGRMLVAEKDGRVRVVTADGFLQVAPLIDLSDRVNSAQDRGLLGIAVDADFASNRFAYLLYAATTEPAEPEGHAVARLERIVVGDDNTAQDGEVILGTSPLRDCPADDDVDCIPSEHTVHTVGTVRAAPDGTLWVGVGDATWSGSTLGDRAFRPYDERSYAGKILHVDRDGRGLPGHPFCPGEADLRKVCTKVHARGFRNPFRFSLLPGDRVAVGDVGWAAMEEIDVVEAGENYGWPCYEGDQRTPGFRDADRCQPLYALEGTAQAARPPVFTYPPSVGNAIVVGPTYEGTRYPAEYRGELFFTDTISRAIGRLGGGLTGEATAFGDPLASEYPVDLVRGPDGDLAYVSLLSGTVKAIRYAPGNKMPIPRATATPAHGALPLTVELSAEGTTDPDGDALEYRWDPGDGSPPLTGETVSHTYTAAAARTARLTVTDPAGRSATADAGVWPGNEPPAVAIDAPEHTRRYRAGDRVELRGGATDPEDGALAGQALRWEVILRHDDHVHPGGDLRGTATSFVTSADHDPDRSFYEIRLTATDLGGLSRTASVTIRPRTTEVELRSRPEGATLSYAGEEVVAPVTRESPAGAHVLVSAPESTVIDGRRHELVGWSDGGEAAHLVTVPDEPLTLSAEYRDLEPPILEQLARDPGAALPPVVVDDDAAEAAPPIASPLVDVAAPGLQVGLRYATQGNVTGAPLPGYGCVTRALLRAPAARALTAVQRDLRRRGRGLRVFDAYRPTRASDALVRWARRTGRQHLLRRGDVVRRSAHNRGLAVDVTLLRAGRAVAMGTRYGRFGPRARPGAARGRARANRRVLRQAMRRYGFRPSRRAWWTFTFPVRHPPPALDVPIACQGKPRFVGS